VSREEKIAQNEALFREVNERVADAAGPFALGSFDVFCECARLGCREQVRVGSGEYERARRDPTTFIVLRGHELPDVEDVVADHGHFLVISKRGEGAETARELDPRQGRV
jgi:hypothetical protein